MNRPNTCTNLIKAINRIAGPERDALRLGRALANVIVAQMLGRDFTSFRPAMMP